MFSSPFGWPPAQMVPMAVPQGTKYRRRTRGMTAKQKKYVKKLKRRVRAGAKLRKFVQSLELGSTERRMWVGESYKAANENQRAFRKVTGYRGAGDYNFSLLNMAGAFSGNKASVRTGNNKITGLGDYSGGDAGGNQIMAGSVDTPITVNASSDLSGDIFLSHREFLGNVTALGNGSATPSAFNLNTFDINPGLTSSFPWLSQIAQNFSLYELQGCIYEYKPTSGELGSATNSLGKVVMATEYDPDSPDFTSSVQMENYDYANACKPSEHMLHGVETAHRQRATNLLYVRTGPSKKDRIFTDVGRFQIATEGLPVNVPVGTLVPVGELWVTYRVRLSRAQLFGALLGNNVGNDQFVGASAGTSLFGSTAWTPSTPYGPLYKTPLTGTAQARLSNTIGCSVTSTALNGGVITFPKNVVYGIYRVRIYVYNSVNGVITWNAPGNFQYCSLVTPLGVIDPAFSAATGYFKDSTATTKDFLAEWYLKVESPGSTTASVEFSFAPVVNLGAICTVGIEEVPDSLIALKAP